MWVEDRDGDLVNLAGATVVRLVPPANGNDSWSLVAYWPYRMYKECPDFSVIEEFDTQDRGEEVMAKIRAGLKPLRLQAYKNGEQH